MSALIATKTKAGVCIATDSRCCRLDFQTIASDSVQKLFSIAHGAAFYASNGFDVMFRAQAEDAKSITATDLREIARELHARSLPHLQQLAQMLTEARSHYHELAPYITGERPLHGFVVAGRDDKGVAGFVAIEYKLTGDKLTWEGHSVFDLRGQDYLVLCNPGGVADDIVYSGATWRGDIAAGAEKCIEALKQRDARVGGAAQIGLVDSDGARWVKRPSTEASIAAGELQHCTLSGFTIHGGFLDISSTITLMNGSQGVGALSSGSGAPQLQFDNSIGTEQMQLTSSALSFLDNSGQSISLANNSGVPGLFINSTKVVGVRQTGVGSPSGFADATAQNYCQRLYNALSAHGLLS